MADIKSVDIKAEPNCELYEEITNKSVNLYEKQLQESKVEEVVAELSHQEENFPRTPINDRVATTRNDQNSCSRNEISTEDTGNRDIEEKVQDLDSTEKCKGKDSSINMKLDFSEFNPCLLVEDMKCVNETSILQEEEKFPEVDTRELQNHAQDLMKQRSTSFSESRRESPVAFKRRTLPSRKRSERRVTMLSGLNLLMPRQNSETEDDVPKSSESTHETPLSATSDLFQSCSSDLNFVVESSHLPFSRTYSSESSFDSPPSLPSSSPPQLNENTTKIISCLLGEAGDRKSLCCTISDYNNRSCNSLDLENSNTASPNAKPNILDAAETGLDIIADLKTLFISPINENTDDFDRDHKFLVHSLETAKNLQAIDSPLFNHGLKSSSLISLHEKNVHAMAHKRGSVISRSSSLPDKLNVSNFVVPDNCTKKSSSGNEQLKNNTEKIHSYEEESIRNTIQLMDENKEELETFEQSYNEDRWNNRELKVEKSLEPDPTEHLIQHLLSKVPFLREDEQCYVDKNDFEISDASTFTPPEDLSDGPNISECFLPSVILTHSSSADTLDAESLSNHSEQNSSKIQLPLHEVEPSITDQSNIVRENEAPPLPPRSANLPRKDGMSAFDFNKRRVSSWNTEADSPPPLPPKRGRSLNLGDNSKVKIGHFLAVLPSKLGNEVRAQQTVNANPTQLLLERKLQRQRKCFSTVIPEDVAHISIEKSNHSDPNISQSGTGQLYPNELKPSKHQFPVENSAPENLLGNWPQEAPPRPPPILRSLSSNDGAVEKVAKFVLSGRGYMDGFSSIERKYGKNLASSGFIEAINENAKSAFHQELTSIPPLDLNTEPRLQHFPVKVDATHHRLSVISNTSTDSRIFNEVYENKGFHSSIDSSHWSALAEKIRQGNFTQTLSPQSSISTGGSDITKEDTESSFGSSTSSSVRSSRRHWENGTETEEIRLSAPQDIAATSSINLLENELPVHHEPSENLETDDFGERATQRTNTEKGQHYRHSRAAKISSTIRHYLPIFSHRKDSKKSPKVPDRKNSDLNFLLDTSTRGLPSDLTTAIDSALSQERLRATPDEVDSICQPPKKFAPAPPVASENKAFVHSRRPSYDGTLANNLETVNSTSTFDVRGQEANNNRKLNSEKVQHTITNLKRDMIEYTKVLENLQTTYEKMRENTPDGIRQRFDRGFNEVQVMYKLQQDLNAKILHKSDDIGLIADAFQNGDFTTYKRYTVLVYDLQKEIKFHDSYFDENFTSLSDNIAKPSLRLNTYCQYLQDFLNNYVGKTETTLRSTVAYLKNLMREANTEIHINTLQKCPVELRLAGSVVHCGALSFHGEQFPKSVYFVLFEYILVITENNHDFRVFKQHYRSEQVNEIKKVSDMEFQMTINSNYQHDSTILKFKGSSKTDTDTWISTLQAWQDRNKPSHKTIALNPEAQRSVNHPSVSRFLPLSLWKLSPELTASVKAVKENKFDSKIIQSRRGSYPGPDDGLFTGFLNKVEEFVVRLDVLLDQESRSPPLLLGSVLRKLRRFYKSIFLPELRAEHEKKPERILKCIIGRLPNIPPLFREYIEVRSSLTLSMEDGVELKQYISPFKHLSYFIDFIFQLSCMARYHEKMRGQLSILLNCVEDSRVTLLHAAITNTQMDFYKTGEVVRYGSLENKLKSRNLKSKHEYHAILFEKAIIFTRPKLPRYEFVQVVWLDQLIFGPQPESKASFTLEERCSKKNYTYELKANDERGKKEWQSDINKLLQGQIEVVKKNATNGRQKRTCGHVHLPQIQPT